MDILRTRNLTLYFNHGTNAVKAADGVDIFVPEAQTAALAGESGCGKTTLARIILGLYKPQQGTVHIDGEDISLKRHGLFLRRHVQIVFQNPFLSLDPRYTIFSALYEALSVFRKVSKTEAAPAVARALEEVELSMDLAPRYPHQLSGGQLQRVCIARALINRPRLVVLDEPTSSLDVTTAARIIELLMRLQAQLGLSFLFISHNLKLIRKIASLCFIMYRGKIVEYGTREAVYERPFHPYTRILLDAANYRLKAESAGAGPAPAGCPFRAFCREATSDCGRAPALRKVGHKHFAACHNTAEG